MDTLRMMLLALLIGASVSTSAVPAGEAPAPQQALVFEQPQQVLTMQAAPTPMIVYVTAQPTAAPLAKAATIYTGTSISRELYRGCQGDDVRMLQKMLKDLKYSVSVDGYFGTQTRNAVIRFQQNNGLKADGIAGTRTIRKLASGTAVPEGGGSPRTTLMYGMVGQDVMEMQYRLAALNYYFDICSGKFLTNTRNAIRWFQQNNYLSVDGIAGPTTLSRLYSPNAIPAGGGPYPPSPTVAPIFSRNLYLGLSGVDVSALQDMLRALNYYRGSSTGYFGTDTRDAVRLFQQWNGLHADGIAGNATFKKLLGGAVPYPGPGPTGQPSPFTRTLQYGMSGTDVSYLQQLLTNLNYYHGSISGYFGYDTQDAVVLFQQWNGLYADGIAGQTTFNKLLGGGATPYPGPYPTWTPGPWPTWTPGPLPTWTPAPNPMKHCYYCGVDYYSYEAYKHEPVAACGVHHVCEPGDHKLQPCGVHGYCANDGQNHRFCITCNLRACDPNFPALCQGVDSHYFNDYPANP